MKLREHIGRLLFGLPDASPATAPVLRPRDQRQDAAIRELLATCATAFVPPGRHVRSNLMTFNADGSRRRVNASTAFNMENDPDRDLEIDSNAAASGKAASERRAATADLVLLQITDLPTWGLRMAEQARVRPSLKSILSVQPGRRGRSAAWNTAGGQRPDRGRGGLQ